MFSDKHSELEQGQRSIAGPMRKWRKKIKNPPAQNRQAQFKKKIYQKFSRVRPRS